MQIETRRFLSSGLRLVLLLSAALSLVSCADSDSATDRPRQVEHPNPMGGPSRYTYE